MFVLQLRERVEYYFYVIFNLIVFKLINEINWITLTGYADGENDVTILR